MGFYGKQGLNVDVVKTAGWALIRDKTLNKEYDAAHMLSPMPLAITLGIGSQAIPYTMPAVENINGQAITLAMKHKGRRDPKQWKGFKFAVPFDFSMHNYLLRYYVAEHGLDPDKDIQIRAVPPAEMVANLRSDNIDGFLGPDPFNQRAVYDGAGFIHVLTREIWEGHPCCAFAASREFVTKLPNTYRALMRAIMEATAFAAKPENRKQIAEAIAPANYLNQPATVIEQVLTGTFADGLGNVQKVPNRIDFDPFPWHSFAIWILTQMKRWGQLKGDVDYAKVAREVYPRDRRRAAHERGRVEAARLDQQEVCGDGQGVRSGQARRLPRELRHQAHGMQLPRHDRSPSHASTRSIHERNSSLGRAAALSRHPARISRDLARGHAPGIGQPGGGCRIREARRRRGGDRAEIGVSGAGRRRAQAVGAPDRSVLRQGPNDKGIGIQLAYSIARVAGGLSCSPRWSRSRSAS